MAGDQERLVVMLEARIRDFEKNMQKAAGSADRSYDRMRRGSRSATRQMERDMIRSTSRINRALASTSSKIGLFAKSFTLGAIGGGSVAGLVSTVRGVVSELSEMGKQMDRVGLSAKAFQELRFGFELAGVSQSDFVTGMEQFTKRIGEATMGTGRLAQTLKANGVEIRNNRGEIKSTEELLREYAELIRNAGSEQEMMTLATEAFGRGGASFVNALRNGEQGLRDMAKAADDAGGTIDEKLIRKAEELDDQWASMWRNFEINAKSSILNVVSAIERMGGWIDALERKLGQAGNSSFAKWLADKTGASDAIIVPGEGVYRPGDEFSPSARVAQAFKGQMQEADADLVAALKERYGKALGEASGGARRTVLPTTGAGGGGGGGRSRNAEAEAALRQAEAVQRLIDALQEELSLIGATDLERDVSNNLRRAGAAATDEQKAKIAALVTALHAEAEAQREATEAADMYREIAGGALSDLRSALSDGKLEWEELADVALNALDRIIDKILDELLDAMSQVGGSGAGGILGFLGSLFGGGSGFVPTPGAGLWADGTANTGGRRGEPRGIVHGQEAVIPLPSGGKVPVQISAPGSPAAANTNYAPTYNITVNGDGMSAKDIGREVASQISEYDRRVAPHTARKAVVTGRHYGMPGLG